ncbi:MAG: DUF3596 domain-containing protein [Phormidesmis sp. CAN_BIN44]|nr:DUF3596 domain-containing protein [Phormidesmis sp. CAN_BIN44]
MRLRWSHEGKRYCLSLGLKDNPKNRAQAQIRADIIERDIEHGMFDPMLFKY